MATLDTERGPICPQPKGNGQFCDECGWRCDLHSHVDPNILAPDRKTNPGSIYYDALAQKNQEIDRLLKRIKELEDVAKS